MPKTIERPHERARAAKLRSAPALDFAEEPQPGLTVIEPERLSRVKFAYTTGPVPFEAIAAVIPFEEAERRPRSGDLLLATVEEIGQHTRLDLRSGRKARLFPGDEVVVCYANRYSPDQFEAEIPSDFTPCDLVAAGGVASRVISSHDRMAVATRLRPVGLLADAEGEVVNLGQWALPQPTVSAARVPTFAVLGTAMNAGKTTAAANLVRGLGAAGYRVGAVKVTGTGASNDLWHISDAGAELVLDCTHAGLPSTYLSTAEEIEGVLELLTGHLAQLGVDAIVLEIADGVLQPETAALLKSPVFRANVNRILFAAPDALGASAGVEAVAAIGLTVSAVSGLLTTSPLAIRETAAVTGLPVLDSDALRDPETLLAEGLIDARKEEGVGSEAPPCVTGTG